MSRLWNVAVAGATGAVGNQMIRCLEERNFPIKQLKLLASARSVGKTLSFRGSPLPVEELTEESFAGVEIALFSAGASTSLKFAPAAVKAGAVVVDNSSAYRMEPHIPLVVPEVNPHQIVSTPGIIANPNCSTIQMVVALKPIHDQARITRIVVSTYQAVSGTGQKAVVELQEQVRDLLAGKAAEIKVYPSPDRLQLPATDRCLPGKRLHQGRDEDGERDPQNPGGRFHPGGRHDRPGAGLLRSFRGGPRGDRKENHRAGGP